jgi:hypothetical protein
MIWIFDWNMTEKTTTLYYALGIAIQLYVARN